MTACNEKNTRQGQASIDASSDMKVPTNDTVKPVMTPELKYCIDYDEAKSWDNVAEKYNYVFQDYSHKNHKYLKGKRQLTNKQAKLFLFGEDESVDITNIWSDEVVSTEDVNEYLANNEFYLTDTIAKKPGWTALIIEIIDVDGSEKFLVTLDKNKRPISKTRIAFYCRSGTYTATDGSRPPWFATKTACIYENLTIKTDNNQGDTKTYSIDQKGHIAKVK
jgi:hypothetical protein